MDSSPLQDLPLELKLQIKADLPVKDVIRLHTVCRELKDVFDNPNNHNAILRPGLQRAHKRLEDAMRSLIHYDSNKGFMEALVVYVADRGIILRSEKSDSPEKRLSSLGAFIVQWLKNQVRTPEASVSTLICLV